MTVHLVGAGPGDPGLITVRELDLLRHCDALVHDVLVADELVAEARRRTDHLEGGLRREELDELLVTLGRRGLDVVPVEGR